MREGADYGIPLRRPRKTPWRFRPFQQLSSTEQWQLFVEPPQLLFVQGHVLTPQPPAPLFRPLHVQKFPLPSEHGDDELPLHVELFVPHAPPTTVMHDGFVMAPAAESDRARMQENASPTKEEVFI